MDATSFPDRLKIEKLSKKGLTDRQITVQLGNSFLPSANGAEGWSEGGKKR
jgi:hypothetical protein